MVQAAIGKRRGKKLNPREFKARDEDKAMAILAGAIRCPGWRHYKGSTGKCIICAGKGMVPLPDVPPGFLGLWLTLAERGTLGQSMDTEDILDELDGGDGTTGGGGVFEEM